MPLKILGVHPIEAPEPCHLIEVELLDEHEFEWGEVTQPCAGKPESNWQAPYDEQPVGDDESRWCFFFHYLDFSKPLSTPLGDFKLPQPTPLPDRLKEIEYEEP